MENRYVASDGNVFDIKMVGWVYENLLQNMPLFFDRFGNPTNQMIREKYLYYSKDEYARDAWMILKAAIISTTTMFLIIANDEQLEFMQEYSSNSKHGIAQWKDIKLNSVWYYNACASRWENATFMLDFLQKGVKACQTALNKGE